MGRFCRFSKHFYRIFAVFQDRTNEFRENFLLLQPYSGLRRQKRVNPLILRICPPQHGGGTTEQTKKNMASYIQIFLVFAKIGAFTLGGGYAMLPLIRDELIRRQWMQEEEFTDIIALAQSAPGLLAVNMSIFTGYRLRGTRGSIVATIGSILPSFIIILAIAMAFSGYQDNPVIIKLFKGIRPVTVALIAIPMINMARTANKTWWAWLLSAATLAAVAFLNVSPIYILLTVITVAVAIAYRNQKKEGCK